MTTELSKKYVFPYNLIMCYIQVRRKSIPIDRNSSHFQRNRSSLIVICFLFVLIWRRQEAVPVFIMC